MNTSLSTAKVEFIQNKNRLTHLISSQPIKWLNPTESPKFTSLYISGYGGGIVQGDQIEVNLECGPNTKVALTTQSYTKAFKNTNKKETIQSLNGSLAENSTLVFLPDPLIPQAQSDLINRQSWKLNKGSKLIVADWFNGGRQTLNEHFSFRRLSTELLIEYNDKSLIWENFSFSPQSIPAEFPSIFGEERAFFNAFIVAPEEPELLKANFDFINQELKLDPIGDKFQKEKTLHGNVELLEEGILNLKFSGANLSALEGVIKCLNKIAGQKEWLDEAPFARKF